MALANSDTSYGTVSRIFHWLTALLILSPIALGLIATNLAEGALQSDSAAVAQVATLFSLHKTIGVAAFFVALLRILWALGQTHPHPLHPEKRFETALAAFVHWLLYGAMLLVPLSGWIHHAAQ
ncbi:MAG: cytochrome b, partial [Lutimaribacter sp.]